MIYYSVVLAQYLISCDILSNAFRLVFNIANGFYVECFVTDALNEMRKLFASMLPQHVFMHGMVMNLECIFLIYNHLFAAIYHRQ